VQFPCPTCKQMLSAPDEVAGQKVACPHCGQKLLLPEPPKSAAQNKTVLVSLEPEPQSVPPGVVSVAPASPGWAGPAVTPSASVGRSSWKTRAGVAVLCGGGAFLLLLVLVVVLIVVLRTPHYTVPELVSAYHHGMRGQRVRVTGPLWLLEPSQSTSGMFIALHAPGQRCMVMASDLPRSVRSVRTDEVVTIVGEVSELVIVRPGMDRHGVRQSMDADVVVLKNARLE
jgi:DNA-directed RNA polymerase subunit RPC12/RpoP